MIKKCLHCSSKIEQSPIGRQRFFCDRRCGERHRKQQRSGQMVLEVIEQELEEIEDVLDKYDIPLTRTAGDYNLPVHLMFERGPNLVLPAPANR